jgi:hypothetical protein
MASDLAASGWSSSGDSRQGVTAGVRDEAAALPARRRLCRLSAKSAAYRRLPDNDLRGAPAVFPLLHLAQTDIRARPERSAPPPHPSRVPAREAAKPCGLRRA